MSPVARHGEHHYAARAGWLRAAVLGANDGIVSTASLIIGVAAAEVARGDILVAGVAGLVAGAMSMAAGEYISVSSQADTEKADLEREAHELKVHPEHETRELARIYEQRGLDAELARQVAVQLMDHDALGAHARDEIGLTDEQSARPLQAALTSALTFTSGAALPLLVTWVSPDAMLIPLVAATSMICLAGLGGLAARVGGAPILRGMTRVAFWSSAAMAATFAVGSLFGTALV